MALETAPSWLAGGWLQTFTGKAFYPLSPRAEDIDPVDIAHALGLICRYGGHCTKFYSVAEHCVLMSRAVAEDLALASLLHDATEAYVGDMIRPLKVQMPEYMAVEGGVWEAVAQRFSIPGGPLPVGVKDADSRILLDERAVLLSPSPHPWTVDGMEPLGVEITGWGPEIAKMQFLKRLDELGVS